MKTINEYIAQYQTLMLEYPKIELKNVLEDVLEDIRFLEQIYLSGGKHRYSFSEKFRDEAYNERKELSKKTSAMYEILRKQQTI